MPKYNKNKLSLIWDKRQTDFIVKYPNNCDGSLIIHHFLNDTLEWRLKSDIYPEPFNFEITNFIKELEERGYDPKTLKFSIELKK